MFDYRNLARVTKTFKLEVGTLRAQGVPAILVAVAGVIVAGGVARTMTKSADRLPEAFREARGLIGTLRGETALPPSRQ